MADKPVYSTATGSAKQQPQAKRSDYQRAAGPMKMRLETKGRGGKSVTVVFNLPLSEDEATTLMKEMQGRFGCGATLKDSSIEIRGDMRDKVEAYCQTKGLKVVRAGG